MSEPRVALVHDWLTGMRGGEKVLLELCRLFPSCEIYTLLWNRGSVHPEIERRVRRTSFLQNLPRAATGYRNYLPLFPAAVRSLKVRDADLVISSSHAVAKGVRVPTGVPHVSYIHTPMRYLWDDTDSYFQAGRGRWWKRIGLAAIAPYLRRFDVRTAGDVSCFLAVSETVRERIRRVWGVDAWVIHPPVDTDYFCPADPPCNEDFYLAVSSLEPYKRIDLAIDAFRRLPRRLVVAGSGSQRKDLLRSAPPNVSFLDRVSDEQLLGLYRRCRALIFPGIEDFGIVPVEALACGKPVVCFGGGGVTESVADGEAGIHFHPQTAEVLAEAVLRSEQREWDPERLRQAALPFSRQHFRDRMGSFLRSRFGYPAAPSSQPSDVRQGVGFV